MNKNIHLIFSFFVSLTFTAQEVIAIQGDSYSIASVNIDFTIGEVIIDMGTDGANDITQGFHQTNWNILGTENHAPNYEAIIFPNPTEDVLNIRTSTIQNVMYTLYNAQGKLVMQDILSAEQTPIQVGQLAPGSYSLEVIFEDGNKDSLGLSKRKIFKLIKQN